MLSPAKSPNSFHDSESCGVKRFGERIGRNDAASDPVKRSELFGLTQLKKRKRKEKEKVYRQPSLLVLFWSGAFSCLPAFFLLL